MDRSAEAYLTLVEELDLAYRHIEGQHSRNRGMTGRIEIGHPDDNDWAALGYTIHNFYNALENYFLRVAKFFENGLDASTWHRDLVDRMTLSIEGVRPALLPPSARRAVHELRSFRHVFRSMYDAELEPARVEAVNRLVPEVMEVVGDAHASFTGKLRTIAASL